MSGTSRTRTFEHVVLRGADLSALTSWVSIGSTFIDCEFKGVRGTGYLSLGAGLEVSTYRDCCFDQARIQLAPGVNARFERCSFRDVRLRHWLTTSVELVDCVFSGRLEKAVFHGQAGRRDAERLGRSTNDFYGNDFSELDLVDVGFRSGIDLARQSFPSDRDYVVLYNAQAALASARASNGDERLDQVFDWVEVLLANGQKDAFFRHSELWPEFGQEIVDRATARLVAASRP